MGKQITKQPLPSHSANPACISRKPISTHSHRQYLVNVKNSPMYLCVLQGDYLFCGFLTHSASCIRNPEMQQSESSVDSFYSQINAAHQSSLKASWCSEHCLLTISLKHLRQSDKSQENVYGSNWTIPAFTGNFIFGTQFSLPGF